MTDPLDLPDRLEAALAARFTKLGSRYSEMRRREQGPDAWPLVTHPVGPHQVAEVLRELLAATPPAPADRDLRDRIADVVVPLLLDHMPKSIATARGQEVADVVLAVLPAPAGRAAELREAADIAYRIARRLDEQHYDERAQGAWDVENTLRAEIRRSADEAQQ
ncbi:hypothetical protein GKQ77_01840 [Streptomyces sp. BG9H]|uniref:Uncharacterized protein n=1 Tax=Streptomyces anatolicus TaxID=2675858 RepID=A0ABS6YFX2_9ACTN|nr:hypothetical protein [Streptomyces anatolicus]MBW5420313.1 hypothetical protein [Streptomyces anatolicus]